jgi:uncharacterized protein
MRVCADDVAPVPWKNGGGLTRELLRWPAGDAWRLRISLADIAADGPFSAFPGVERWFAVLEGDGVELQFGDRLIAQRPGDAPLRFDGADAPGCRLLGGPTRDLNLMLQGPGGELRAAAAGDRSPAWPRRGFFVAATRTLLWPFDGATAPEAGFWIGTDA